MRLSFLWVAAAHHNRFPVACIGEILTKATDRVGFRCFIASAGFGR
jgi:hypothetical protein